MALVVGAASNSVAAWANLVLEVSPARILVNPLAAHPVTSFNPMTPDNYFTVIVQSITDLLTRHSEMFVAMGGNLFRGFAIILISWFGAKVALSSSNERHAYHFGNFAGLPLVHRLPHCRLDHLLRQPDPRLRRQLQT